MYRGGHGVMSGEESSGGASIVPPNGGMASAECESSGFTDAHL